MQTQTITPDFLLSQLRLALVAVLAYGGGAHWFTPEAAGLYLTLFTTLGPIVVPWAWSIFSNLGRVSVQSGSAAAQVATVEKTDPASASFGARTAVAATVKILLIAFALSFLVAGGSAMAQTPRLVRPTGNIVQDIAAATGSKTTITGAPVTDIQNFLNAKFLPDLQYALKLATASKNTITADCYQAWIDIINTQQTAVTNPDGSPLAMPDPHVITEFEKLVELRNALQPESPFMIKCSPVASMVKLDIAKFMGVVIAGGAGLATMVPGL